MKRHFRGIVSTVLSTLLVLGTLPAVGVFADTGDVTIDESTFPDQVLRDHIKGFDQDSSGTLSQQELSFIVNIDLSGTELSNLSGIEHLPYLMQLSANNCKLTSVDISGNSSLNSLACCNNKDLTYINISDSALGSLSCSNCSITEIKMDNKVIHYIDCSNNNISSLSFYAPKDVQYLDISNNSFTNIDTSEMISLIDLNVSGNNLTSIDVSKVADLHTLDCSHNLLTELDVSKNANLQSLYCGYNNLTSIDVSNNSNLSRFACNDNSISELNLGNKASLECLICYNTNIPWINVEGAPKLVEIANSGEKITKDSLCNSYYELNDYDLSGMAGDSVSAIGLSIVSPFGETFLDGALVTSKNCQVYTAASQVPTSTPTQAPTSTPTQAPAATDAPKPVEKNSVSNFVERLYTVAMDRPSDPSGKQFWTDQVMMNGKTGTDLALSFLLSKEFLDKDMSDAELLDVLYETCFGRAADPEGKAYWLNELSSGRKSKKDVIMGFVNSTEWANICLSYGILSGTNVAPSVTVEPNEQINSFAERLYTTCLGRASDPSGLSYWANELSNLKKSGSETAKGFFFSEEMEKKGLSDEEFVTKLYQTLMGRNPDPGGMAYWMAELESGRKTRMDVFNGFAASSEWAGICAAAGILK